MSNLWSAKPSLSDKLNSVPELKLVLVDRAKKRGGEEMGRMRFAPGTPMEPQIVYGHRFPGESEIFHIGSGTYSRAIRPERGKPWIDHVADRDVEVLILETYECPARARLREAELIAKLQPKTNFHHKGGPNKQVIRGFTKRGIRCDCGAVDCYGQEALKKGL